MQRLICALRLLPFVFLASCGTQNRSTPTDDTSVKTDLRAVKDFYLKHDIGGGWLVMGLHSEDGNVVGKLSMSSDDQSCGFLHDSQSSRENAISNACPSDGEGVWTSLQPSRDIVLEVSCRGRVFYRHSCRSAHRMTTPGGDSLSETAAVEQLAAKGDALSESRLGVMYAEGDDGKPLDPVKAVALYKDAAKQGFSAAQDNLAGMYADGQGVPKDLVLAYAWYAVSGSGSSEISRSQLKPKMKPSQVKTAMGLASKWKVGVLIQR